MTKDVIISLSGLQYALGEPEPVPVEVLVGGQYYKKNGQHYALYDEVTEGFEGPEAVTHNTVKFSPGKLEVKKKGLVNVQMVFEEGKKNVSFYRTPFGIIHMGIAATRVLVEEQEKEIIVTADYALDMNDAYAADCTITIKIRAKGVR